MPKGSMEHQEIVRLLGKLKEETPEYPADLLEARKYTFMKQIVDANIAAGGSSGGSQPGSKPKGQGGGSGPSGAGGAGAALRSGTTFLGLSLKTVIAIGAVILLLTAGYLYRDQITEVLAENGLIRSGETTTGLSASPVAPGQETPPAASTSSPGAASSGNLSTQPAPGSPGNATTQQAPGASPGQGSGQVTATPTPQAQNAPFNIFQYLICILQPGSQSCR